LIGKQQPVLLGNDNFTAAPSGTFSTKDGYINIAANKQEQWEALVEVLGLSDLKTDPRFQRRDMRKKNRRELTQLIETKLREKKASDWIEMLNARNIPAGEILSLESALNQEQILHRETLRTIHAEGIGDLKLFNLTAKFDKTPAKLDAPPPRLSEHTNEILTGLGYTAEQIESLRKSGAI
jgi:CoA:oxalate CoA-transferase